MPKQRTLVMILALTLGFGMSGADGQTVWHVDDDAPLGGDGTSWQTAFKYLQEALAIAQAGDEIRIAQGVYKPDQDEAGSVAPGDRGATFQLRSGVAVRGGYAGWEASDPDDRDIALYESTLSGDLQDDDPPSPRMMSDCCLEHDRAECDDTECQEAICAEDSSCCLLYWHPKCVLLARELCGDLCRDPENSYHVLEGDTTGTSATLDGVTVSGGYADGPMPNDRGGGMYNERGPITITDCTFQRNLAVVGGGMYDGAHALSTLRNCVFVDNRAAHGGGLFEAAGYRGAILTACVFSQNRAEFGAGLRTFGGRVTVQDCHFVGNLADERGGGAKNDFGTPTYKNCVFIRNCSGLWGGGVHNFATNTIFANCIFAGNTAEVGGAVHDRPGSVVALHNCTVIGNTAAHLGGGIYNRDADTTVVNSILWENAPSQIYVHSGSLVVSYSAVMNGWPGPGIVGQNPIFVDASGPDGVVGTEDDDLRLSAGSPCIDAGNNTAVPPTIAVDLDGNPRFTNDPLALDTGVGTGPIVDMGAYERQVVLLDIEPRKCPNRVRPRGGGFVHMVVVGDESFDVTQVDVESVELKRTDGVGRAVRPLSRRYEPPVSIRDVTTPFGGDLCACHTAHGDAIDDLILWFSKRQMIRALALGSLDDGEEVVLTLAGTLADGTEFGASDCITIIGSGRPVGLRQGHGSK